VGASEVEDAAAGGEGVVLASRFPSLLNLPPQIDPDQIFLWT
jgi:hypothetical protein